MKISSSDKLLFDIGKALISPASDVDTIEKYCHNKCITPRDTKALRIVHELYIEQTTIKDKLNALSNESVGQDYKQYMEENLWKIQTLKALDEDAEYALKMDGIYQKEIIPALSR
jgi:hypothetical protein